MLGIATSASRELGEDRSLATLPSNSLVVRPGEASITEIGYSKRDMGVASRRRKNSNPGWVLGSIHDQAATDMKDLTGHLASGI